MVLWLVGSTFNQETLIIQTLFVAGSGWAELLQSFTRILSFTIPLSEAELGFISAISHCEVSKFLLILENHWVIQGRP